MKSSKQFGLSRREVLRIAAATGGAGLTGIMLGPLAKTVKASDQYSSVVLAKGPVGYWRLGEASGPTAADASGNSYDGTYLGNPTLGQAGAIVNDPDTAVGLNGPGSMDYVEIADTDSHPFSKTSDTALTVEAWMRPDSLTFKGQTSDIYIHWLGKGEDLPTSRNCEWGLRFYSNDSPSNPNRISAYIWSPTCGLGAGAGFTDVLTVGEWIHLVAVYDAGDKDTPLAGVSIYKNGALRDGPPRRGTLYSSFNIVPTPGIAPLRLGTKDAAINAPVNVSYLTGGLDEVAIYPRALSQSEIQENYCTGSDQCF